MNLLIKSGSIPPDSQTDTASLKFGKTFTPNMLRMTYANGAWENARIEELQNFSLHPASAVLHYGQEIFEGLKAFRHRNDAIYLFRPKDNLARMNYSARRMSMPEIDTDFVLEALRTFVSIEKDWVPPSPGALYLRPTMIATQVGLGAATSTDYEFYVIASPSGGYFGDMGDGPNVVSILVSETYSRAALGGTGDAKTGGNYAASLLVLHQAHQEGCQHVLFLSSPDHKYVEELGGINLLFVRDNVLVTPSLTGTILDGITRKTALKLASEYMSVCEERITIDDLIDGIRSGRVSEAIACGTGAGITCIGALKYQGDLTQIGDGKPGPVTRALFDSLTGIQYGKVEDKFNWLVNIRDS
jgi:branched-chain amino acid aminotransferase